MGTLRDERVLRRCKSLPCHLDPWNVDKALSSGHQNSRESLKEMRLFLKREHEDGICHCKRQIEADLEELKLLKRNKADLEKDFKLRDTYDAEVKKELQDVTKKYDDLLLQSAAREEFCRYAVLRQLLTKFKTCCPSTNRELIRLAQAKFPEEFPKESRSLIKFAGELFREKFSTLGNSIDSGKFWDLMKLAYNLFPKEFPDEKFGALMRLAHDWFPKEFPREKVRILMRLRQGLFFKEVSEEKLYVLMKLGRELFSKEFPHEKFGLLMRRAHDLFPKEFPQVPVLETFTGMVTSLVNRNSTLKDENIEKKLSRLQDLAITYKWSEFIAFKGSDADFGKQLFVLCRSVPQWNDDIFHPNIEGMERIRYGQDASKGLFRVDDLDMKLVVKGLLYFVVDHNTRTSPH